MHYIPVSKPYFWGDELTNVTEAVTSGWISSNGKFIDEFEVKFAEAVNARFAVALNNGTSALQLACDLIGLKRGDEVIVPDFSMIAPLFALEYIGCVPVPIDVDDTWNMDPSLIENEITEKTKAILVVHNYGHPASMIKIAAIAKKYKLRIIEDAAEAIGAEYNGIKVGSWGDVTCYSLYANKIITTGEGGMLTTNNEDLYNLAKFKRNMAFGSSAESRFIHKTIGYNFRLPNIQAAIGCAQIIHLEDSIKHKINIASEYSHHLKNVSGIVLPPSSRNVKNVYWVYGILIEESYGISKNELQTILLKKGIETRNFFMPVHKQPFLKHISIDASKYHKSVKLAKQGIYLPSFIGLSYKEISKIADTIAEIQLKNHRI
ncbi:DegT/DnrJ/EryC1/StrS family aminotransferase [Fulvivirga sediminis]|uniref:DegT/DnrJ/EryC1/StrS family aminotransferase n=1 Tax=Fulvivirga sediminis TaxID=2803949 RepID=A0A937F9N1_9BACT|nr:DegT/DnrJ/EryC1/StrS family aminotransferase [Fulvivirga sediminis]MBL3659042.1 DegT/DnrJ/EryC1/StrS family aminotransferase [Fulvivirga sediminis]